MQSHIVFTNKITTKTVIEDVLEQAPDAKSKLAILTGGMHPFVDYDLLISELKDKADHILGGTVDGGFSSISPIGSDYGLSVIFLNDIECEVLEFNNIPTELPNKIKFKKTPNHIMIFSESLEGVDGQIISELIQTSYRDTSFSGLLMADRWQFKKTYQFNNKKLQNSLIILGLSGDFEVENLRTGGFFPIHAEPVRFTAKENRILTLNGVKADEFYLDKLGSQIENYQQFPLSFYGDLKLMRAPREIHKDGSIELFGSAPNGLPIKKAQIMQSNTRSLIDSIDDLKPKRTPKLSFFKMCAGRKYLQSSSVNSELESIKSLYPNQYVGGFGYGEFCNGFLNQSNVVTNFY